MDKKQKDFIKQVDDTLQSIYSKINGDEKDFLSYLVYKFNIICERNYKAIEVLESNSNSEWEDVEHIDQALEILKGENND